MRPSRAGQVFETLLLQPLLPEISASHIEISCSQIAQLLAIMRYDDERATALAHLILVLACAAQSPSAACCPPPDAPLFSTAMSHAVLQRCYDGHEGSALLSLCDVFDTDAKLESAFQHVRERCLQCALWLPACD